jgi:hypothetical protein
VGLELELRQRLLELALTRGERLARADVVRGRRRDIVQAVRRAVEALARCAVGARAGGAVEARATSAGHELVEQRPRAAVVGRVLVR